MDTHFVLLGVQRQAYPTSSKSYFAAEAKSLHRSLGTSELRTSELGLGPVPISADHVASSNTLKLEWMDPVGSSSTHEMLHYTKPIPKLPRSQDLAMTLLHNRRHNGGKTQL